MAEPFIAVPSYYAAPVGTAPSGTAPSGIAAVDAASVDAAPVIVPRRSSPATGTNAGAAGRPPPDPVLPDFVPPDPVPLDVPADALAAWPAAPGPGPGASPGAYPAVVAPMIAAASSDVRRLDVSALGPLAPFAAASGVTDLFVNGAAGLWVDSGRGAERQAGWTSSEQSLRALATSLIARGGRHVDEATPCVDVRLADGIRVHAVLPPASSTGTLLSIRLPAAQRPSFDALVAAGLCGAAGVEAEAGAASVVAQRLRLAVAGRENLLITGAAGSGKTTLLAALLAEAPARERIVVIEDVAELRIGHPHVVGLECRQPNLEGAGRLGLDTLLREALRMRPDRLVLGECRGGEIRELLSALNTGHDGGAGTLHANSLADVPARLEALGALAGLGPQAVARQAVSALHLVVHLGQSAGQRRVQALGRFFIDDRDRLRIAVVLSPGEPPGESPTESLGEWSGDSPMLPATRSTGATLRPGADRTASARHAAGGDR